MSEMAERTAARRVVEQSRVDLTVAGMVAGWIGAALWADVGAGLGPQRALGVLTWIVLAALLRREASVVRSQVLIVVAVATGMEFLLSLELGFYDYRLANVPAFVPPGHGLVYLAALALGRSALFARYQRALTRATLAAGATWALWGVTLSPRADTMGLLLFACFAALALGGDERSRRVYAAAFLVTGALEVAGTALGTWSWAPRDPSGVFGLGNPPSGIAGAYCVLDAIGLAAAPVAQALVAWRVPPVGGEPVAASP